jgi:hypothetical protein
MTSQQETESIQGRGFLLYASFLGLFLYSANGGDKFLRNVDWLTGLQDIISQKMHLLKRKDSFKMYWK